MLPYTSGTVTAPKGVPIPYRKFLANARLSAEALEITPDSILLSAAPLFARSMALFSVNLALAAGATVALLPAFSPPALAEAIDRYRPTQAFTAPAHMTACLQANLLNPERLASLRFLQISGSACPPELAQAVQAMMPNGKVTQLWGMSELQAGAYHRPGDPLDARMTSAGRASPGTELRVMLDDSASARGRGGRIAGARLFGVRRLSQQRGSDRGRIHAGRLVSHRRSRAHGSQTAISASPGG